MRHLIFRTGSGRIRKFGQILIRSRGWTGMTLFFFSLARFFVYPFFFWSVRQLEAPPIPHSSIGDEWFSSPRRGVAHGMTHVNTCSNYFWERLLLHNMRYLVSCGRTGLVDEEHDLGSNNSVGGVYGEGDDLVSAGSSRPRWLRVIV